MSGQILERCAEQLTNAEFSRVHFLRLFAQICIKEQDKQIHLVLYAFYHFAHTLQHKLSLQTIERGLQLHQETLPAAILLGIKSAILTKINKHTEALQILKQALQIMRFLDNKKQQLKISYKRVSIRIASKLLLLFDFSRGRRQFLVILDEIKGYVVDRLPLQLIFHSVTLKMAQIRESVRCSGKSDHEKKLLTSSTSMGALQRNNDDSSTSIYINRLYEERRKNLGQREKTSNFKKQPFNPYQLNIFQSNSQGECFLM